MSDSEVLMRPLRARFLVLTLVLLMSWSPAPAPVDAAGWEVPDRIWAGVNFFRHSNKTFHKHLRLVETKKTWAKSYARTVRLAGHAKLADALEKAYLREADAIARANVREISRVRNRVKNVVAFFTGRQRRTYNTARAIRVLQLDKEVQDATLDRRLIEAQAEHSLKREGSEDNVKYAAIFLATESGVSEDALVAMDTYDKKWISEETQERLESIKDRVERVRTEAKASAAASGASSSQPGKTSAKTEPPRMVASSDVSTKSEGGKPEPPGGETLKVDPGAGDGDPPPESGEPTKGAAVAFTCEIMVDQLTKTGKPVDCFEKVEAQRRMCLEGCKDDSECKEVCDTACDAARNELCVTGFTCEIEMTTLFGAGDRKECFDKIEAQRRLCLEMCEGDAECEAVCNTACDQMRAEKCAPMKEVFQPQETRD